MLHENTFRDQSSQDRVLTQQEHTTRYPLSWNLPAIILRLFIREINLILTCDGLPPLRLGDDKGSAYVMAVKSPKVLEHIIKDPDLYMGESYMEGQWDLNQGDLGKFLTALLRNEQLEKKLLCFSLMRKKLKHNNNNIRQSRKNTQHHYDLGNDLYASFLDKNMNYSCAFFDSPDMDLKEAQSNKINKAIRRLDIMPGMNVLDIGSGWGNTCREIEHQTKASVINGITLSKEQLCYAIKNTSEDQKKHINFYLEDYREHAMAHPQHYDRIISIGMFEHVGAKNHEIFFENVRTMLKPGGKALIHTILSPKPVYEPTTMWLDKYIFPGGCIPYLPAMLEKAEHAGLKLVIDPYIHSSYHYAETLRRWRKNFLRNANKLDREKYNQRFRRMWNYYLSSCEAGFDGSGLYVGQVVLERPSC